MVSEDAEEQLFKKHADLCNKLNLDSKAVTKSWESFVKISSKYSLEGDALHWLGCAVFEACRSSVTPTIGSTDIEGNCVSLTSLLRYCNLNLIQFFTNIRHWSEMKHLPDDFRKKIDNLEESFSVTCNVFKEYCSIFPKIFKTPELSDMETPKQHRNRKQKIGFRSVQCSPAKIFEFIWNLYITVRGEDPSYGNDLVQSYHLLLGICDLAFKNAFLTERRDLLNPEFSGLPSDWLSPDFTCPDDVPCIIDQIISNSSNSLDAKYMEKYHCRNTLSLYFKNGTLFGNELNFIGLFDPQVFESNFKAIKKAYETQLLSNGGFDERIFLAEYRRRMLEREQESQNNVGASVSQLESVDELQLDSPSCFGTATRITDTPLTGRRFLSPRDGIETNSSVVSATQNIARLQVILNGQLPQASDSLKRIFQSTSVSPMLKITEIVNRLSKKFIDGYVQLKNSSSAEEQNEEARNRLLTGTKLFYKLIERILEHEITINKDISVLVQKDIFYECVYACSLEIVLHCYNNLTKFPWILTVLEIDPCDFVKIIELVVRSKDPFHRNTIKHLNKIEETILESLAWKSNSSIWKFINQCEKGIPKEEEVALPSGQQVNIKVNCENRHPVKSEEPKTPTSLDSPGPSAAEQFQSPIQGVNRELFPTKQILLKATDNTALKINLPDDGSVNSVVPVKPKRTGGLSIFFRKFYNLAAVRMNHLCSLLNITDSDLQRKIWTVFEVSIQKKADSLLKDRHLDQLLMCAVYVIPKVLQHPQTTFMEIMKCYRQQPQADSYIYRDVLLERRSCKVTDGSRREIPERRGDLIEFYNSVYVFAMRDFTIKFANGTQSCNMLMSPLPMPSIRRCIISPSVQIIKNVFVKPLDSPVVQNPNIRSYSYFFSRSPSRDLKDINKAINNNSLNIHGKRLLIDGDELTTSKKIATRKVQSLLEERRRQY